MPTVETRASHPGNKALCVARTKPSISCIASHAYWDKVSAQRELKYATSFQKSQDYLDSLREEVTDGVFKGSIDNNTTPVYVFEEIKGIYHTPEHPLINKGLLAATKHGQLAGYTTPVEPSRPTQRPKSQPPNRSFYRPNSTHNYLTKTIALGGSHDGFNPKHGTPTRAQLLRNRLKFTSAPDLTYTYIAQKKEDGKHEAVHLKTRMAEEALQLKANKIEMDKTAGKYRKYMIGSKYNTEKWLETHMHYVSGMVARRNDRPASSFTPKSAPLASGSKRRAVSAVAASKPLREDAASQTFNMDEGKMEARRKEKYSIPFYRETKKEVKRPLTARSPNLVPYTASVNCAGKRDSLASAIIIKPASVKAETREAERLSKRLESARRLKSHIEGNFKSSSDLDNVEGRAPTPSVAVSIKENAVELKPYEEEKERPTTPTGNISHPVFLTNEQEAEDKSKFLNFPASPKDISRTSSSQSNETNLLRAQKTLDDPDVNLETTSKPEERLSPTPAPIPHPVMADLRSIASQSETLSKSQEFTATEIEESSDYVIVSPRVTTHSESLARASIRGPPVFGEASSGERVESDLPQENRENNTLEDISMATNADDTELLS